MVDSQLNIIYSSSHFAKTNKEQKVVSSPGMNPTVSGHYLSLSSCQLPGLAFVCWPLLVRWVDPLLISNPCLGTGGSVLPTAPTMASQPGFRAGSIAFLNSKWESAWSSILSLRRRGRLPADSGCEDADARLLWRN